MIFFSFKLGSHTWLRRKGRREVFAGGRLKKKGNIDIRTNIDLYIYIYIYIYIYDLFFFQGWSHTGFAEQAKEILTLALILFFFYDFCFKVGVTLGSPERPERQEARFVPSRPAGVVSQVF